MEWCRNSEVTSGNGNRRQCQTRYCWAPPPLPHNHFRQRQWPLNHIPAVTHCRPRTLVFDQIWGCGRRVRSNQDHGNASAGPGERSTSSSSAGPQNKPLPVCSSGVHSTRTLVSTDITIYYYTRLYCYKQKVLYVSHANPTEPIEIEIRI